MLDGRCILTPLVIAGLMLVSCADNDADDGSGLSAVADPRPFGCAIQPVEAHPPYGEAAIGDCDFNVLGSVVRTLYAPLPEVTEAISSGTALPADCRTERSTGIDGTVSDGIPNDCPFSYEAVIGTPSATRQIVEYSVTIDALEGCWAKACSTTIRLDYQPSNILPGS